VESQIKADKLAEYRRLCREKGLSFTAQRRAILEAVLDRDTHPRADDVYAALSRRKLRVSRATVFRTLESLARLGIIAKAAHTGSAVRYDCRTDLHHHLVCTGCDRVIDLTDARLDAVPVPDTRRFGFVVSDFQVQLRGICRDCREQEDKR
jgi:Fur family transcriptional regulator, peroxide stress response regulator